MVAWVFTGAAFALTAGRYAIRLKILKKPLKADDYVHGLALVFLVGFVPTYIAKTSLEYSWIAADLELHPSDPDMIRYFHIQVAVALLFWIVVYLVKSAFLLFYRFLFSIDETFMRIWWFVTLFTGVTFLINFTSVFWLCGAPRHLFALGKIFSALGQLYPEGADSLQIIAYLKKH